MGDSRRRLRCLMRFFSRRISRAERAVSWSSSLLLQLEWRAMAWELD